MPVSSKPRVVLPGQPSITSIDPGDGSLTVNYTAAPGFGSTITGYTASCGSATTAVDGSTLTATVTGLTLGGDYSCTLYASDVKGRGSGLDWSGVAGPPAAPIIRGVETQDGQLTVEFVTVVEDDPLSYTATCGTQSATINGDSDVVVLWDTVSGLTDGTTYTCSLFATNTAGNGPSSTAPAGTPNPIPSSPTASTGGELISVSCPSTTECVAVGAGGDTLNNTGLVEVSSDGGHTFSDEPVPMGTPELNGVSCFDPTHCVAVGGSTALVSTDGGTSWKAEFAGQDLGSVTCLSDTYCLAGGTGAFGSAVTTSNGGTTWEEAAGPSPELAQISCNPSICVSSIPAISTDEGGHWKSFGLPTDVSGALTSVACLSASTCVMVGSNAQGLTDPEAPALSFTTTDDGQTWVDTSSTFPSGSWNMNQISCPTSSVCYAFGYPSTPGGAQVGATSIDGGGTWTSLDGPTNVAPAIVNGNDGAGTHYLSCPSISMCVVVGTDSSGPAAAFTTDGAATWSQATSIG